MLIDCSIEVCPLAGDLDVGLVDVPPTSRQPAARTGSLDELRREALHPSVDGDVVNGDSSFAEQLLDIAVGKAVAQIPAHRDGDHFTWEAETCKRRRSRGQGHPYQSARGHDRPTQHRPLRLLAQRALALQAEIDDIDDLIKPLTVTHAPELVARYGVGPDTASALLVAVGDNPERLRSEASFARLCGVAPIPATSGKTSNRHRLHRGGDRQANAALWRIVMTRMSNHPETRRYVERRTKEGLSKREIMRCLKRYVARELFAYLPRETAT